MTMPGSLCLYLNPQSLPFQGGHNNETSLSFMTFLLNQPKTYLRLMADCNILCVLLRSDVLSNPRRVAGIKRAVNLEAMQAQSITRSGAS